MFRSVAALCSLCLLVPPGASGEIVERVVARVNGEIVTLSEFETRQVAAVQTERVAPDDVEAYLRDHNAQILQDAVDDLLLQQKGAALGLRLRPEYIAEFVDNIRKENGIETDAGLEQALAREGLTLGELKRNIERSMVRRQVLAREVEPKAAVSDAEVRADYEARAAEYEQAPTVQLQEIIVRTLAEAQDVARRLSEGEDFAALARALSIAPSASSGGDLGRVTRDDLAKDLAQVAFSLEPGTVSAPIEGADGWRLMRVAERTTARRVPLSEVQDAIRKRLSDERYAKAYDSYIQSLRDNAIIELRVREVPLQVQLPATPSLLEPTPAGTTTTPPANQDDEFSVTPQARPESVKPPDVADEPPAAAPASQDEKIDSPDPAD